MKTILIAHNYTKNSFSAMSYFLARHLAKNGFQVIFISHKPFFDKPLEENIGKGKVMVYSWSTQNRPTSIKDFIWFSKIFIKYRPSLVIGHFVGSNISILASKFLSFNKVKAITYYHTLTDAILKDKTDSGIKYNFLKIRKKIFYHFFVDRIVTPSEMGNKDLIKAFGYKKGVVIPNPIIDRFVNKKELTSTKIIISFLGRLDPTKGVIEMLIAFKKYITVFPSTKLELQVAGAGSLENEVSKYFNIDKIKYKGVLKYEEVDNYLNNSHFVIIPSLFDNFPTVGLESLMNHTPLLISNSTGLTSYLTDQIDSFKFDPTVESIYEVFKKVEDNSANIVQMGVNARSLYCDNFSISKYCETMYNLIQNFEKNIAK
jgi:glycosyltransferase involved in cell wall biosynthesis